METMATVTSKGQVTLPSAVRRALSIRQGDRLMFTISDHKVIVEKTPDFLSLAGSIPVPPDRRGATWDEVMEYTRWERGTA